MSQVILQNVLDGGSTGMLIVVTGASHVTYGSRGTGVPARISGKIQKKNQVVILLDPERQFIRREGEVPVADFLWYSAARPCSRNCFDRAEIARVMNAAGRRRDALPQVSQHLQSLVCLIITFLALYILFPSFSPLFSLIIHLGDTNKRFCGY